jgi:hypothetical protein
MTSPKERRRFPRVTGAFPLRSWQFPVGRAGYSEARVEDLSAGGVRFRCASDARVRSSLLLELVFPGEQPVRSFGRVAWVRELPGDAGFEIGGVFEEQSTKVRAAIGRHLSRAASSSP